MHEHRPPAPSRDASWHRVASHGWQSQIALPALIGLVIAVTSFGAVAIGPNLPLEFREVGQGIEFVLDPTQIAKADVQQILYDHGRPVREQQLDLRPERRTDSTAVATVPLQLEQFSGLEPGYYALKLVAVGAPSEGSAEPLHIERWLHFAVDKAGVRRVSAEEYANAVDPAEVDRSELARQILIETAAAVREKCHCRVQSTAKRCHSAAPVPRLRS